jgi:hypothetical protein
MKCQQEGPFSKSMKRRKPAGQRTCLQCVVEGEAQEVERVASTTATASEGPEQAELDMLNELFSEQHIEGADAGE